MQRAHSLKKPWQGNQGPQTVWAKAKTTLCHNEKLDWTVKTSNVMSYGRTGLEHWVSKPPYSFQCRMFTSQTNKLEFIWKNTKVVLSELNKIVPQKRSTTKNRSRRLMFTLHVILHQCVCIPSTLFRYAGINILNIWFLSVVCVHCVSFCL